jgi:hypothetical protein
MWQVRLGGYIYDFDLGNLKEIDNVEGWEDNIEMDIKEIMCEDHGLN